MGGTPELIDFGRSCASVFREREDANAEEEKVKKE